MALRAVSIAIILNTTDTLTFLNPIFLLRQRIVRVASEKRHSRTVASVAAIRRGEGHLPVLSLPAP
jgi:hypothetical protein